MAADGCAGDSLTVLKQAHMVEWYCFPACGYRSLSQLVFDAYASWL